MGSRFQCAFNTENVLCIDKQIIAQLVIKTLKLQKVKVCVRVRVGRRACARVSSGTHCIQSCFSWQYTAL
jgi:hypothetical protein